jgi:hypothetical protein
VRTTKIPNSRAAERRWDQLPAHGARVYIHAVLLDDPARPPTRAKIKALRLPQHEPTQVQWASEAPDAVCGRNVHGQVIPQG